MYNYVMPLRFYSLEYISFRRCRKEYEVQFHVSKLYKAPFNALAQAAIATASRKKEIPPQISKRQLLYRLERI